MKRWFLISALVLLFASCKDRTVHCTAIGDSIKSWSVYDLHDTIRMTDEFGNDTSIFITQFTDSKPYTIVEKGGFMKKTAECTHQQTIADNAGFFWIFIEGNSSVSVKKENKVITKKPLLFSCDVHLGDASSSFWVNMRSYEVNKMHENTFYESDYAVGNVTYSEAIVCKRDTAEVEVNVYQFIYAKDKGLVRFSTRSPHKTWTIQ